MKHIATFALAALIATPAVAEWNRIDNKNELAQYVLGKNFVEPKTKAWFNILPDGTLTGGHQGKELTGTWKWRNKRVCYTRALGGEKLPDNCIAIHVDGNNLATTRQSNGSTVQYVRGN